MYLSVADLIDDLLAPLISADGGHLELIEVRQGLVKIALRGPSLFGADAEYVKFHVIVPAIKRVAGEDVDVEFVDPFGVLGR